MNLPAGVTNRIVLVRHGEPAATARGRCYGRLDVGLSKNGKRQIEQACEFLRRFEFSAVYASPRVRASESAQIIAEKSNLFYETIKDFAEIDFGDFEGLTYKEVERRFPESYRKWMETPTKVEFPNGESFAGMKRRVLRATADLRAKHAGEAIVAVAHGGVNRIILAHFLRIADEDIFRLEQTYASVSVIDFYGEFPLVKVMNHNFE
jgi:alpha-ribazole phosphatase